MNLRYIVRFVLDGKKMMCTAIGVGNLERALEKLRQKSASDIVIVGK